MEKQTISLRLQTDRIEALDALADSFDRDRTYVIAEAIDAYLETQKWHMEQIEAGLADAEAGRVVDHAKVKALAAKWRRSK